MSTKIYKCGFIADIKTVSLALKFPCLVSVIWKRGEKTAQIKQRKQIKEGIATFNEKLQIQSNMSFNSQTQKFEQKKTKFTVVILSEKGNKQAGQVYFDVSELLNQKLKKLKYSKNLDKCPDRNALLTFQLSGYIKQQISKDSISQASSRSTKIEAPQLSNVQQPNFKKKKKQALVVQNNHTEKIGQSPKVEKNAIPITKQNIPKVQINALQQQNKKMKESIQELRDLQIQNQNLKMQYQQQQKKTREYYSKKYEEIKIQYTETRQKLQNIKNMKQSKKALEQQLYQNKDVMAGILNYAVLNKMNDLAEELTNIYSMEDRM